MLSFFNEYLERSLEVIQNDYLSMKKASPQYIEDLGPFSIEEFYRYYGRRSPIPIDSQFRNFFANTNSQEVLDQIHEYSLNFTEPKFEMIDRIYDKYTKIAEAYVGVQSTLHSFKRSFGELRRLLAQMEGESTSFLYDITNHRPSGDWSTESVSESVLLGLILDSRVETDLVPNPGIRRLIGKSSFTVLVIYETLKNIFPQLDLISPLLGFASPFFLISLSIVGYELTRIPLDLWRGYVATHYSSLRKLVGRKIFGVADLCIEASKSFRSLDCSSPFTLFVFNKWLKKLVRQGNVIAKGDGSYVLV